MVSLLLYIIFGMLTALAGDWVSKKFTGERIDWPKWLIAFAWWIAWICIIHYWWAHRNDLVVYEAPPEETRED